MTKKGFRVEPTTSFDLGKLKQVFHDDQQPERDRSVEITVSNDAEFNTVMDSIEQQGIKCFAWDNSKKPSTITLIKQRPRRPHTKKIADRLRATMRETIERNAELEKLSMQFVTNLAVGLGRPFDPLGAVELGPLAHDKYGADIRPEKASFEEIQTLFSLAWLALNHTMHFMPEELIEKHALYLSAWLETELLTMCDDSNAEDSTEKVLH